MLDGCKGEINEKVQGFDIVPRVMYDHQSIYTNNDGIFSDRSVNIFRSLLILQNNILFFLQNYKIIISHLRRNKTEKYLV